MDANKKKKYLEVVYGIQRSCQLCKHASFRPQSNWGSCGKHTYNHLKHTDSNRQMSIYRSGICADFEKGAEAYIIPEGYAEFIV